MNKIIYISVLVLFISQLLTAQNREDYFKTIPEIAADAPEWVQLMYSSDPNVFEVDQARGTYYATHTFEKTTDTQNYKHWRKLIEEYVNDRGYIRPPSRQEEDRRFRKIKQDKATRNNARAANNDWENIGPFETYKLGTLQAITKQANIYALDQSASNPNILYAGTESGGVFKTINRGIDWTLVSENEVFSSGMSAIQIHPTNPDIVLVGGNRRIYRTQDGGATWASVYYTNATSYEIKFHPTSPQTIYCSHSLGLVRSNDGGTTWTMVFNEETWDIDFHPSNPDTIYILKENAAAKRAELFRSDDQGATWTIKNLGWYVPTTIADASTSGGKIAISAATPDIIYVCLIGNAKSGDNGWIGVYRSDDRGESWLNPSGQDGGPYAATNSTTTWNVAAYSAAGVQQGFYNFDMEASPNTAGLIWIGTIRLTESADSGKTFSSIGGSGSTRLGDVHADIQDIEVNGDEVWVANDGGLEHSPDKLQTHTARNTGISAANFWGFGTGWNEDVLFGGKYHNGNSAYYQTYGIGNYHIVGGVEEATGYVNPIQNRKVYYRTHYNSANTSVRLIPDVLGGDAAVFPDLPLRANESYVESYRSGLFFDPRYADHTYIGRDSIIWKSTDGGANFEKLHSFPAGLVLQVEISKENPDYMYVSYQPGPYYWNQCKIYRTTDGGATWTALVNPPSVNTFRIEMTLNPADENEIWVSYNSGANGTKVYSSIDGGTTWVNRTTNVLDGQSIKSIFYQGGTDKVVYLATTNSFYYWDNTNSNWVIYDSNLPLVVQPLKIRPFYRDAKLRLATSGRGIFSTYLVDTAFVPVAQPITYTDTVRCSRDTTLLECFSVLRHRGASWQWTITPAPAYISSTTVRNPKVVFGSNGSYTIRLQVTDENGNTDTKTIPNMITVASVCEPDSIPSMALHTASSSDRVQLKNGQMKTATHFTFTAWIKPDSAQDAYAGIVSNGAWCAHCATGTVGLTTSYSGDKLWFRVPGTRQSWAGNSNLTIPLQEWSYVALVVEPTQITLYLNDQKYVSTGESLSPIDIDQLYIGYGHYYKGFKGDIDEVSIWEKALTEHEIKALRHLTKHDLVGNDPDLFAYFQFNKTLNGTGITDDGGLTGTATLQGAATLIPSTAPVGAGVSQKLSVLAGGQYDFNQVGLKLDFPTSGTVPDGDVYATRLHLKPDTLPNANPSLDYYWIVNNYGNNKTFSPLTNMRFTLMNNNPSTAVIVDPNKVQLYKRTDNAHLNDWVNPCGANNVQSSGTGYFDFNAGCNMNSFSQFFLTSNDASTQILPVDLLAFEAEANEYKKVELDWQVAQEKNLADYTIQHSANGIDFENIGTQIALGNSTYSFLHPNPVYQYNYYRLLLTDTDGQMAYSPIKAVWIDDTNQDVIRLFPNPVGKQQQLTVSIGKATSGRLQIYKSSGKLAKDILLTNSQMTINLPNMAAGVYFYTIETNEKIQNGKLVVQ